MSGNLGKLLILFTVPNPNYATKRLCYIMRRECCLFVRAHIAHWWVWKMQFMSAPKRTKFIRIDAHVLYCT
uniref:Uncharacterized protein n=1 Tax=Pararge aegeria TaxID=116150 RepID=S4P714_9NEOP